MGLTQALVTVIGGVMVGGLLATAGAAVLRARVLREPLPIRARIYVAVILGFAATYIALTVVLPIVLLFV